MKKLALTTLCALAVTASAFAQGTLSWNAFLPSAITAQTNATAISPLFSGTAPSGGTLGLTAVASSASYIYELLYNTTAFTGSPIAQPSSVSALGNWTDSGLRATNTLVAGRVLPFANTTAAAISGWTGGIGTQGGTTNYIMLVGLSSNLGTSWSAALGMLQNWDNNFANAYFGMSTTGYLVPNTGNPGAVVFNTTATLNGLPIMSLNTQLYVLPVPEPSTIALAGLGGLSLLLFRRRQ